MNKTILTVTLLAACLSSNVQANGKLTCPATVKAGTALTIAAEIKNDDCNNPINVQNTIVSMVGNSGGTVGLQGPFVKANNSSIPKASCQQIGQQPFCGPNGTDFCYYQTVVTNPGTLSIPSLTVVNKVPAGLVGTLIGVTVGIIDTKNNIKMAKPCSIIVN